MRSRSGEAWQKVATDPSHFWWFVLLTAALGVFSGALTDLLNKALGETSLGLAGIAAGGIVVFAWTLHYLFDRISRSSLPVELELADQPAPRRGLIVLVSQEAPVRKAIDYHRARLECCWLLCSTESAKLAGALAEEFGRQPNLTTQVVLLPAVDSPEHAYEAVRGIHDGLGKLGLDSDEVIADYLGMTAHCSVGMALACLDGGWRLQCTRSAKNADGVLQPLDPVEIRFDFRSDGQSEAPPAPTASLAGTTEVGT